jgi:hypothetical protein
LAGQFFVFPGEYGGDIGHCLFLAHVFGVGVVVDGIFADPDFQLIALILADHVFGDPDRSVDGHQSAQGLQGEYNFLFVPVREGQHAVGVEVHLSELFVGVRGGVFGECGVEVEEAADGGLVVGHAGGEECGLSGEVFE